MKAEERIYRTVDGQLVRENDPRGAFLGYSVGDEINATEVDAYRELLGGSQAGHEVPGLMHDRLATEIARAQQVLANNPPGHVAQMYADKLAEAARLVDAGSIPPPPALDTASPVDIVRQVAVDPDGDREVATVAMARTTDGRLVRIGDPDAATLAYAPGQRIEHADRDAYAALSQDGDLGDGEESPKGSRPAKATGSKASRRPADKAAATPEDK